MFIYYMFVYIYLTLMDKLMDFFSNIFLMYN